MTKWSNILQMYISYAQESQNIKYKFEKEKYENEITELLIVLVFANLLWQWMAMFFNMFIIFTSL